MSSPTIKELKKFKHPKGDPRNYWFDGVSTYVVKLLFHTPITPLQVNFSASVVGVCMGFFFITGTLWGRITGVLLFFLYIILDAVDGQLARARDDCTLKGHYLDNIGHYVVYPFVSMAMGYGNYLSTNNILMVWAGFIIGLAMTLSSASRDCFKAIYKDAADKTEQMEYGKVGIFKKAVLMILRFESMLYLVLFSSVIDTLVEKRIVLSGLQLNIESHVIILYALCLFILNIAKVYIFFSRERLVSR